MMTGRAVLSSLTLSIAAFALMLAAWASAPPAAAQSGAQSAAQSGAQAGETAFLEGSEDIPLMPGLTPAPEAGIVFDSPAGRIVEAFAGGAVSREAVLDFYGESLPPLGWAPASRVRFLREGEGLSLDFFGPDGALTVRFTLAPADP